MPSSGISHWQHPVLVLRDVPFIDLYTILEFIYMGEVNISQGDLQSFLKTAELLQIKGLTENVSWNPETDAEESMGGEQDEETPSDRGETPDELEVAEQVQQRRPSCKRRRVSEEAVELEVPPKLLNDSVATNHVLNTSQAEEDMEFKEEIDLDEESNLCVDESAGSEGELLLSNERQTSSSPKLQVKDDPIQGPSPNHKKCKECGIQMLKKNFARHMRDMHTSTPKPRSLCPLCQKSYKTADWLKDHIRRGHGYSKELTDQVMASLESGSTNSESRMKNLSLEESKLPPLLRLKEPSTSIAMIDITSQPITILTSQTVVKEEKATQKI